MSIRTPSLYAAWSQQNAVLKHMLWLSYKFVCGLVGKKKKKKLISILEAKIKWEENNLWLEEQPFRIDHEFYFPCHHTMAPSESLVTLLSFCTNRTEN